MYNCSCNVVTLASHYHKRHSYCSEDSNIFNEVYDHPEVQPPLKLSLTLTLKLIIHTLARAHAQTLNALVHWVCAEFRTVFDLCCIIV